MLEMEKVQGALIRSMCNTNSQQPTAYSLNSLSSYKSL